MEEHLANSGAAILKFWMHIDLGSKELVSLLIAPPFPAASQPSNAKTTGILMR